MGLCTFERLSQNANACPWLIFLGGDDRFHGRTDFFFLDFLSHTHFYLGEENGILISNIFRP